MPLHHLATIAVLGADTVVGSALCALLGGCGYRITPIGARLTGVAGEMMEGADLLLLVPRLGAGAREAFLGAMGKSVPRNAHMPMIALRTALEESPQEERVESVPWPCETRVLVQRIEAAILGAPAPAAPAPAAPTVDP